MGAMQPHRRPHPPSDARSQRPPFPSTRGAACLPACLPARHGTDTTCRWPPAVPQVRLPPFLGTRPLPAPFGRPASLPSPSSASSPMLTGPGGLGGEEEGRGGRQQGWFWPRQRLSPPSPPELPAHAAAAGAFLPAPGGRLNTPSSCWSCSWEASASAPWATSPSSCRALG